VGRRHSKLRRHSKAGGRPPLHAARSASLFAAAEEPHLCAAQGCAAGAAPWRSAQLSLAAALPAMRAGPPAQTPLPVRICIQAWNSNGIAIWNSNGIVIDLCFFKVTRVDGAQLPVRMQTGVG